MYLKLKHVSFSLASISPPPLANRSMEDRLLFDISIIRLFVKVSDESIMSIILISI